MIQAGEPIEIWGWAWSFRRIAAAEVSIDRGKSFTRAKLEPRRGWARQRFALSRLLAEPREVRLCIRAIEANGTSQPRAGARNAIHTVRVIVSLGS